MNGGQQDSKTNHEPTPLTRYIGKCVYCGSTDNLTDEHIVPYGLKGIWQLLKGSCEACNQITSAFEGSVLREQFMLVRAALALPTRRPQNRPREFSFVVDREGRKENIVLPVTDCPAVFMMPGFEKPGHIMNYGHKKSIKTKTVSLHGLNPTKLKDRFNIEGIWLNERFSKNCFELMLAKVAYGMTILTYGPDALKECYVLPCILGLKDDVGYWVGSSGKHASTLPSEKEVLHRVCLTTNSGEISVLIRLFANYQTPEYLVIVGRLK